MESEKRVSVPISKKTLEKFVEEYVGEYIRAVEKSRTPKGLFPLYESYPFRVIAYVAPRKTLLEYRPKQEKFSVQVKKVEEMPKIDRKKRYIGAFRNDYLLRVHKRAKEIAREDVLHGIREYEFYEESQEELDEYYDKQLAQYVHDYATYIIDGYVEYIESAYEVKKETVSRQRNEIYDIVKIIYHFRGYLVQALLMAQVSALFHVFDEVGQDMESSFFLAMHGKYKPANALLRRILETIMTALYFDSELRKCKPDSKTYKDMSQKKKKWIEESRKTSPHFTGEYGVLGRLIDPDTDYIATEILKVTTKHSLDLHAKYPFRAFVRKTYTELCKFVHYGGLGLGNRFSLEFARFNEKWFKRWVSRFKQLYEICNILVAIKFPEVLEKYEELQGKLQPFEQVSLLTHEQVEKLKSLTTTPPT